MSDIDEARERERFEAEFPLPNGVTWNGDGYTVADRLANSYVCDRFVGRWIAWLAAKRDAASQAAQREDTERLDWLASNPGMELDWGEPDGGDEGDSYVWRVHQRRGSRNDREWRFLGQGTTPRAAIDAARAAGAQDARP